MDEELGAEIRVRLADAGFKGEDALVRWAGVENLEERIGEDPDRIDPVVLEALREGGA